MKDKKMEGTSETSKQMCRLCMKEEDVVLYVIHENPGSGHFDMPLSWRIVVCLGIAVRTCSYAGCLMNNTGREFSK
jgi:hypothetical protein